MSARIMLIHKANLRNSTKSSFIKTLIIKPKGQYQALIRDAQLIKEMPENCVVEPSGTSLQWPLFVGSVPLSTGMQISIKQENLILE